MPLRASLYMRRAPLRSSKMRALFVLPLIGRKEVLPTTSNFVLTPAPGVAVPTPALPLVVRVAMLRSALELISTPVIVPSAIFKLVTALSASLAVVTARSWIDTVMTELVPTTDPNANFAVSARRA